MQGDRNGKKKKNKAKVSKNIDSCVNLMFTIAVISIVIAVALAFIIYLPKLDLMKHYGFAKGVNTFFNKAGAVIFSLYAALIVKFGELLFKGKKFVSGLKTFIVLFVFSLLFFLPFIVSEYGTTVVDTYTQQMEDLKDATKISKDNDDQNDETEEKNTDKNEDKDETSKIVFVVCFQDVLFESYDLNSIEANRPVLERQICDKIHSKIENFNKNADTTSFEEIKQQVYDYERTYKFYNDEDLFSKFNTDERINKLNDAIRIRKEADNKFMDSDNQRLIAIRYIELGDEMRHRGEDDKAIEYYAESIFWNLTALQTLYNENLNDNESQMYENIAKAYRYLTELYNENDECNRRATILYDLYSSLVTNLNNS